MLIVSLGFTAYSFMLSSPFRRLDDEASIINNPFIKDFKFLPQLFTKTFFGEGFYYRPLVSLTYMLEYHWWGLNPFYYNLDNLLLHLITSLVVYFLIQMLFHDAALSFFVGLLFSIHPIHWESVGNISGRAILLSSLFTLLCFLFFGLSRQRPNGLKCYFLALVFFLAALLSKESAATTPLILSVYLWFFEGEGKPFFLKAFNILKSISAFLAVETLFIIWRSSIGANQVVLWEAPSHALLGFLSFIRSIITDIRLFVFPLGLHFDRTQRLFPHLIDLEAVGTLLAVVASLFLLKKYAGRWPRKVHFLILWFWADLIPVSQVFIPIGVQPGVILAADHFLYTASVSFFTLLVIFSQWFYQKNLERHFISSRIFFTSIVGILLFFFLTNIQQNIYASHEIAMYERSLHYNPDNVRIRICLALVYAHNRRFKEAEEHFRKVLKVDPHNAAQIGLGKALIDQGKYWEGIAEYEKIKPGRKYDDLLKDNLRLAYNLVIAKYQEQIKEYRHNPDLYYSLGVTYSKAGRIEEAIAAYEDCLLLEPRHKNALFNLAVSYQNTGNKEKAAQYLKRVLSVDGPKTELDRQAIKYLESL